MKKKVCRICHDYFEPQSGTQRVCSFPCAIKLVEENKAKAKKKERRKKKQEFNDRDRKKQLKLTQIAFNKMRVLEELKWFMDRGQEPTCISCGRTLGGDQWCCGHFKTRGAHPALRFDRNNAFLQHNYRCNMNMSGDIEGTKDTRGYKKGLIERFGEKGQEIIDYCESKTDAVKWNCEELIEMRKEFNQKIRELKETI